MNRLFRALMAGALGCTLLSAPALADERTVPLDKLPAAVRDAVTKEAVGGQIEEVKQVSDDAKLFKAEIKKAGEGHVLYLDETGKILGRRKD